MKTLKFWKWRQLAREEARRVALDENREQYSRKFNELDEINNALRKLLRESEEAMAVRDEHMDRLEKRIAELMLLVRFRRITDEPSVADQFVVDAFKGISEEDPVWRALHKFIDAQIRLEAENVCLPNLTDAGAHFNRGRLAALENLKEALLQLWSNSKVRAA